jgi:LemA protein
MIDPYSPLLIMTLPFILIGIVILAALIVMGIYNSLVSLRNRVQEGMSDIGVQQKRRWDLIPNLIETVKGYATHEKDVFTRVTEARTKAMTASQGGDMQASQAAENVLSGALKTVFALAEAYPDLKANQNFMHLQQELVDAEDKIQAARRFYNQMVQQLNTKVQQFPSNMIASMFGFKTETFFQIDATETAVPQVKF